MDNALKEILLKKYQVRKSKKQKQAFCQFVQNYCSERGLNCTVEEENGLVKSRNIVVGDISQAQTVFTAHYDTCAELPFPNFITPMNLGIYLLYQLVITAALFLPAVAVRLLLMPFSMPAARLAFVAVLIAVCLYIFIGKANRHTANDNTSGVAALLNALNMLTPQQLQRTAFVLFDNEEIGLLGSSAFARRHKTSMAGKLVINLDCVGEGDTFLLAAPKAAQSLPCLKQLQQTFSQCAQNHGKQAFIAAPGKAFYPSDQKHFQFGFAIASLKKKNRTLYMDKIHTRKDTTLDETNIDAMGAFISTLAENESVCAMQNPPKQKADHGIIAVLAVSVLVGFLLGFGLLRLI